MIPLKNAQTDYNKHRTHTGHAREASKLYHSECVRCPPCQWTPRNVKKKPSRLETRLIPSARSKQSWGNVSGQHSDTISKTNSSFPQQRKRCRKSLRKSWTRAATIRPSATDPKCVRMMLSAVPEWSSGMHSESIIVVQLERGRFPTTTLCLFLLEEATHKNKNSANLEIPRCQGQYQSRRHLCSHRHSRT